MANVCGIDKGLRIAVGAVVLALTFVGPFKEVLYPWGVVALVPLATGLMGWCPVYSIFGFRSCKT
ncbi:MAG: DUF2892 domain-containing protein [Thiogranum sp.]|jgi:hypothetical protein